jgi:hypothetical protein
MELFHQADVFHDLLSIDALKGVSPSIVGFGGLTPTVICCHMSWLPSTLVPPMVPPNFAAFDSDASMRLYE